MNLEWMKKGVIAVYDNPQHGLHGEHCILKSGAYIKNGRWVVDNTLFTSAEHAHLFIPDGYKTVVIPGDLLEKHKKAVSYIKSLVPDIDELSEIEIAFLDFIKALEGGGDE